MAKMDCPGKYVVAFTVNRNQQSVRLSVWLPLTLNVELGNNTFRS
jgi:hypothetical protein